MNLGDRLRAALKRPPAEPLLSGDDSSLGPDPTPAAVLIAITDRPEPGVILTVRHADLRTHAGQVAFPGGRIDRRKARCAFGRLGESAWNRNFVALPRSIRT